MRRIRHALLTRARVGLVAMDLNGEQLDAIVQDHAMPMCLKRLRSPW
jgi:hypothetical protein